MNINRDFKVTQGEGNVVLKDGTELNMTAPNYMYLQMLQNYVLEILYVIDDFCKKHNLKYYLGEGTLLGAVRHEGFIPWDDDIDLFMPREDYEKFFQLAKDGLPEGYVVDTPETNPKHWTCFSHVEMTRTVPYIKKRLSGIALFPGPAIDIMPMDYVPSDCSKELVNRGKLIQTLRRTLWIKSGLHKRSWYKTLKRRLTLYYPLKTYGMFRSFASFHKQINALMTKTNNQNCDYTTIFSSLYETKKETFKREYFGEPKYVPFAGGMFPIPQHADKILERVYGDYLGLPEICDRKSKHFFTINNKLLSKVEEPEILELVKEIRQLQLAEKVRIAEYEARKSVVDTPQSEDKKLIDPFEAIKNNETSYQPAIPPKKVSFAGRVIRFAKRRIKKVIKFGIRILANQQKDLLRATINHHLNTPVKENYVIFDSFSGLGILDSPRTIFKNMLAREEFKDFKFIWTVNDTKVAKHNLKEFSKLKNVILVKRNSKSYAKYLTISKYLICNSSVPMYYAKRPEQVYLNTWHGVPLKVMGYERVGQRVNSTENIVRNFFNATHVIGANHFTAERMFKQAYMFDGIYNGKLLDEPLPRTDTPKIISREESLKRLAEIGIKTNKKIIVYAPTWKGKLYNSVNIDLTELKTAVKTLKSRINTKEYKIYLRVHYFIYRAISMDKELSKICIPFTIDTNELLPAVDILISDYSSIFFDFLGSKKPILFYVPDLADYSENRGLYIPLDKMPGPVSEKLEDIADYINNIEKVKADYQDKYLEMFDWCCQKEDANVTNRVIDDVFFGKDCETVNCKNGKKRILIMADFESNFVNKTKLLKYFDSIDYETYDVTLLTAKPKSDYLKDGLENINKNVRILINNQLPNVRISKAKRIYKKLLKGKISFEDACTAINMSHEWRRLVGECEFDQLVFVQPKNNAANWMLLSYIAPIQNKVFIKNDTIGKNIFENKSHLSIYNNVYNDFSKM